MPQSGPPTPPPNATAAQLVQWEQDVRAYNAAHPPGPSLSESVGNWFTNNVGMPGSSHPSYDPNTGKAVVAPISTPPSGSGVQKAAVNAALGGNQPARVQSPGGADRNNNMPPPAPLPRTDMTNGPAPGMPYDARDYIMGGLDAHNPLDGITPPGGTTPGNATNNYFQPSPMPGDNSVTMPTTLDSSTPGGMFSSMKPADWMSLAGLGAGGLGAYLTAKQQGGQFDQQMALAKQQLAQNATQLNPYKQQTDLFSAAAKGALAKGGPAQAQFGTPVVSNPTQPLMAAAGDQYLNPTALASAKTNFDNTINGQQAAVQAALQPKSSGSGFWHKFAKIAAIAAPIIAAPFTGGASLALIGAGAGAASGALNGGGLKGALLGGALGAIPMGGSAGSAASGVAKNTLKSGLVQAGKSVVKSPSEIMALTNALRH